MLTLALIACNADNQPLATEWPTTLTDTNQLSCYDEAGNEGCPDEGEDLYGQDAHYLRYAPSYTDNGDGTVTDDVTGLVWQWEQQDKVVYADAESICDELELGGRDDWRVPTITEAYSLMQFDGATGSAAPEGGLPDDAQPYLDEDAFDFRYGDEDAGERYIDVQFITTNLYVSAAFADNHGQADGEQCFFGVNHADGRIKCYPTAATGSWQLRCVAGEPSYGVPDYEDMADGTITDHATGLMWTQDDSGDALDWGDALAWCEGLDFAGYDDWRLPDARELQALVDYTRSPDTTSSAAIDPVFSATGIVNEAGDDDFGWYWTSTTHLDGMTPGTDAVYVAFGEALGYTTAPGSSQELFLDVHGAGAQRGDPKAGSEQDYPQWGQGPQGDVRRVYNLARCVREAS